MGGAKKRGRRNPTKKTRHYLWPPVMENDSRKKKSNNKTE